MLAWAPRDSDNPWRGLMCSSRIGAVWVSPGAYLTTDYHEMQLVTRLQKLLDIASDPHYCLAEVMHGLRQTDLAPGGSIDMEDAMTQIVGNLAACGWLRQIGATPPKGLFMDRDNRSARQLLMSEPEDPDEALLSWVSAVTAPILSG